MLSVITPTHNIAHIHELYDSLLRQTYQDWEWVVVTNNGAKYHNLDERVRIVEAPEGLKGIGALKQFTFMQGHGDYLVEVDHDDLLAPTALEELAKCSADFVYSNAADFFPNGNGHWFPAWRENGWRYRDTTVNGKWYNECLSFEPSAASISTIYYAPNHFRAWKKDFYHKIGGHNPAYEICDDHELVIRTYLNGSMQHIDKCLYLYRMGNNTFSQHLDKIRGLTNALYIQNIDKLIVRESELSGLPIYDLGGGFNSPPGWKTVDLQNAEVIADLNAPWPFEDNSVLAFRAYDIVEHLSSKQHVMRELHRCLVPGGWALIQVPSTDGRGAFCDPTHISYWNECSFWYYTRPESAKYIRNTEHMFMTNRLFTFFPSDWHKENNLPYVKAELRKQSGDMVGIPGVRVSK